jgi:hypothetical protein
VCTTLEENVAHTSIMLTPNTELVALNTLRRASLERERERGHT